MPPLPTLHAFDRAGSHRLCIPKRTAIPKDGGQGEVVDDTDDSNLKIKIYNISNDLIFADRKLRMMLGVDIESSVMSIASARSMVRFTWPKEILYEDIGRTCLRGFSMQKIDSSVASSLLIFFNPTDLRNSGYVDSIGLRIDIAVNLAEKLVELHRIGACVPDLNAGNVFIYRGGGVALIDCDGFSFHRADGEFFAGVVAPEICSPERQNSRAAGSWDAELQQERFALGVQIFRLLNRNNHPYDGRRADGIDDPIAHGKLVHRIREGYYPYGIRPHAFFRPVQDGSLHEHMPKAIRRLFDRCFQQSEGDRPAAEEWLSELRALKQGARSCAHHGAGAAFVGLGCPLCNSSRAQAKSTAGLAGTNPPTNSPWIRQPTPAPWRSILSGSMAAIGQWGWFVGAKIIAAARTIARSVGQWATGWLLQLRASTVVAITSFFGRAINTVRELFKLVIRVVLVGAGISVLYIAMGHLPWHKYFGQKDGDANLLLSASVEGRVESVYYNTSTIRVAGRDINLRFIQPFEKDNLALFLADIGRFVPSVRCEIAAGNTYRCTFVGPRGNEADLSEMAVRTGAAQPAIDAPLSYQRDLQYAQQCHLGMWANVHVQESSVRSESCS